METYTYVTVTGGGITVEVSEEMKEFGLKRKTGQKRPTTKKKPDAIYIGRLWNMKVWITTTWTS